MTWAKNELTAAKRTALLRIYEADGVTPANRSVDFTGYVYLGKSSSTLVAAAGTIANIRRPLVIADDTVESVDTDADTTVLTAHDYETGDGPFTSDEAIGTLSVGDEFWMIYVDDDTVAYASSLANAYAGTKIALTGTEDGATISDKATTQRGLDGEFLYTATQAETNFDGSECLVIVEVPDGELDADYTRAVTSVEMGSAVEGFEAIGEGSRTNGDLLRLIARTLGAKFTVDAEGNYQYRDLDDTKDSHNGQVTSAGRISAGDDDLT